MSEADKMFASLQEKTGRGRAEWVALAQGAGLDKHGQIIAWLKSEHGLTHGFANLVALAARGQIAEEQDSDALIEAQYAGKEALRPIYEALRQLAEAAGPEVEVAVKKTGVSFRRKKQFVLVEPKTKTRVDVGINLRGHPGTERLKPAGGMCTHKVGITSVDEVDDELAGWIAAAWVEAG